MTRIFITTLALAFLAMPAQAHEPSAEAKAAVGQALAEIGCREVAKAVGYLLSRM